MISGRIRLLAIAILIVAEGMVCCEAQLQRAVDRALRDSAGTIVVTDMKSRKVIAQRDLGLAAQQLVRPGSTLKPLVLEELLKTKRVAPKEGLVCRRPLHVGSVRLDCSHAPEVRQLNAEEAIAYSCNSYVAEVTLRLSGRQLTEALRRAGLDSPSRLAEEEVPGRITRPTTREQLQLMALGLRGIEVTPLELLQAYRQLALRRAAAKNADADSVYQGLEDAVQHGTAHAAFVEGLSIAGKTGTATNMLGSATHGLFVGYAPAKDPQIAIVVYIPQSRGLDAAAVAQQIFAQYQRTGKKP